MHPSLYDTDFHAWAYQQAGLLRAGQAKALDVMHLAEEIEDIGKRQRRELESRLKILFLHLLQWQFQPGYRGASWQYSIEEQRAELADHVADNPSLKSVLAESVRRAYGYEVIAAARETGLPKNHFPASCPWSFEKTMDATFYPD